MRNLVLASGSPRRRELLSGVGLSFQVMVSDADEKVDSGLSPDEIVRTLAFRKASAIANELSEGIVIGADTIVVLEDLVLGKPKDEQQARQMLKQLQGRVHTVYSGVAVIDAKTGQQAVGHRATRVHMRPLSDAEIEAYVKTGEPLDKAGSYAIQGIGSTLVERIEGDYFTVVGLPMELLASMLTSFDIHVLKTAEEIKR
ncbi:Maf family protein [Effusibacillus dendaii]|uniref:dTTP/UTP pyrophosphatase n=1 Tax=Effusibacillus dendaii TaxID=2743772 RepID=A0A7I8DAY3_9BACL|nr:Maf-like protein [Effusibacillus dendaii]